MPTYNNYIAPPRWYEDGIERRLLFRMIKGGMHDLWGCHHAGQLVFIEYRYNMKLVENGLKPEELEEKINSMCMLLDETVDHHAYNFSQVYAMFDEIYPQNNMVHFSHFLYSVASFDESDGMPSDTDQYELSSKWYRAWTDFVATEYMKYIYEQYERDKVMIMVLSTFIGKHQEAWLKGKTRRSNALNYDTSIGDAIGQALSSEPDGLYDPWSSIINTYRFPCVVQ